MSSCGNPKEVGIEKRRTGKISELPKETFSKSENKTSKFEENQESQYNSFIYDQMGLIEAAIKDGDDSEFGFVTNEIKRDALLETGVIRQWIKNHCESLYKDLYTQKTCIDAIGKKYAVCAESKDRFLNHPQKKEVIQEFNLCIFGVPSEINVELIRSRIHGLVIQVCATDSSCVH